MSVSLGSQLCEYGVGVQCSGGWLAVSIIRVDTANTTVPVYQNTWRHIPEDDNLHTDCPENLSCHAVYLSLLGQEAAGSGAVTGAVLLAPCLITLEKT